jgi:hypothetical protein
MRRPQRLNVSNYLKSFSSKPRRVKAIRTRGLKPVSFRRHLSIVIAERPVPVLIRDLAANENGVLGKTPDSRKRLPG